MGNQNIPFSDETWSKIQNRAKRNGRSGRQEVVQIVEAMLEMEQIYVTPEEKALLLSRRSAEIDAEDKRQAL